MTKSMRIWQRAAVSAAALGLVVSAAGCKSPAERKRVLTKDQQQQIADNVLTQAPTPKTASDIDFEGHIRLLGYDLEGEPKAGQRLSVTMYYRVDKPLTGDWKVFVHFEAPGKRRQPYDHYGVGDLYPVGLWKQGEIIRDRVDIDIPADWPAGKTQLLVGFFDWGAWSKANQNRRLKIQGEGRKLATNDDRVVLTTVEVTGGKPTPPAVRGSRGARGPPPPAAWQGLGSSALAEHVPTACAWPLGSSSPPQVPTQEISLPRRLKELNWPARGRGTLSDRRAGGLLGSVQRS